MNFYKYKLENAAMIKTRCNNIRLIKYQFINK